MCHRVTEQSDGLVREEQIVEKKIGLPCLNSRGILALPPLLALSADRARESRHPKAGGTDRSDFDWGGP